MRKSGLFYPFLLLVCWTGLVAAGTYALISTTVRQELALGYSTVRGKIILSQLANGTISRRGLDIEYNYVINGIEYTGHRFRYDDHNAAFEWDTAVDEHPRWSEQVVYYNPANPVDSVLLPGIDGGDYLLLLFALPINVVTVMLWKGLWTAFKETGAPRPAGGVPFVIRPGFTEVRLGDVSGFAASFYAMGAAAFLAAFPVVIFDGFEPTLRVMMFVWIAILALGAGVFAWRGLRNWSGLYNLRIDKRARIVTLPRAAGRKGAVVISAGEISAVALCRRVCKNPSGLHFSYLPVLKCAADSSHPIKLTNWGWSERKARAFAEWLGQELGKQFSGIDEEEQGIVEKSLSVH